MKILTLVENSLIKLTYFYRTIFSNFSFISSIHANQLVAFTPEKHIVKISFDNSNILVSITDK